MDLLELGLKPFVCLAMSVLVPLVSLSFGRRAGDLIAVAGSIVCVTLASRVFLVASRTGIAIYRFGGFPPPIGVVYVADSVSSALAMLTSLALLASITLALASIDGERRHLFYALAYLLVAGVYGCLFTGDLFNLYVSIELVAISSYALTAFHKSRRAIRAALLYGVSGTVVTSFLLLVAFLVYGSYGTVNMVDVALKVLDPGAITPFSGGVFGDVVLSSKVALALVTWTLLFKSGIMPNHFWLPEAYSAAPLPAIILFTAGADTIGVYGLLRLYYTVFPSGGVLDGYKALLFNILLAIGAASALVSSLLVSRQTTIRKLVAYSSISQFSLALLGVTSRSVEGVSGSVLHIVANGLGDAAVIYSVAALYSIRVAGVLGATVRMISKLALVVGLLNLFGVVPLLPGFWSKALITLGFINAGIPIATAVVLISSGLCAVGYLRIIVRLLVQREDSTMVERRTGSYHLVALATLLLLLSVTLGIGIAFLASAEVRSAFLSYGSAPMNVKMYVDSIMPIG